MEVGTRAEGQGDAGEYSHTSTSSQNSPHSGPLTDRTYYPKSRERDLKRKVSQAQALASRQPGLACPFKRSLTVKQEHGG